MDHDSDDCFFIGAPIVPVSSSGSSSDVEVSDVVKVEFGLEKLSQVLETDMTNISLSFLKL